MKKQNKIALIGATGKVGQYVLQELLRQSYTVKVLVRDPDKFQFNTGSIEVITGNARDYQSVFHLMEGCQAVISALGQPKDEAIIFSEATSNILKAMEACNISRYILLSGVNVDTPHDKKTGYTQTATEWMKLNYPEATRDRQKELAKLAESSVHWTLVRLPMIDRKEDHEEIKASLEDCPGERVSARGLAHFLVLQLNDESFFGKAPFVAGV